MDSIRTPSCISCNGLGKFYCNGCKKIFCQNHAGQHQEFFDEQLDWLTVDYNDLDTKLSDRLVRRIRDHPSMQIIDRWENETIAKILQSGSSRRPAFNDRWKNETIAKIRQSASDTRQAFIDTVKKHDEKLATRLRSLINELSKASKKQSKFDERQVKQWSIALRHLKQKIESISTFSVHIKDDKPIIVSVTDTQPDFSFESNDDERSHSRGLVPIRFPSTSRLPPRSSTSSPPRSSPSRLPRIDRFEWVEGNVQIQENGQIIVHNSSTSEASVRGLFGYQSGRHELLFRIERMYNNHWMFFGVASSRKPLYRLSYSMPSAYGWAGFNAVYVNGNYEAGKNGYRGDMKENNIVKLILDCDRHILYMSYSRSIYEEKLTIDVSACPFPWHFLVSLYNANDSVRILPLSMSSIIEQERLGTFIRETNNTPETPLLWPRYTN
jgi:hypothetical protein